MNSEPKAVTLAIASGAAVSEPVRLMDFVKTAQTLENRHFTPKGIILPVTTGTVFGFEVSEDGSTWFTLKDTAGTAITVTKAAASASAHPLSAQSFAGWGWLRVTANSGNEGSARSVILKGYEV